MPEAEGSFEPQREQLLNGLQNMCAEALNDASDWYGRTVVTGIIISPSDHELTVVANQWEDDEEIDHVARADELVESTCRLAVYGISHCILPGPDTPEELTAVPAERYFVEEQITEIPGHTSGHIARLEVRIPTGEDETSELVTLTTASVHTSPREGEEFLYAQLWSKDGRVVKAEVSAIPHADEPTYDACVEMFGEGSRAQQLMEGLFVNEDELDRELATIREAAVSVGVEESSSIDVIVGHIRRMGLAASENKKIAGGATPERIMRLNGFVRAHTNAQ